jgi:hypothetical protein
MAHAANWMTFDDAPPARETRAGYALRLRVDDRAAAISP